MSLHDEFALRRRRNHRIAMSAVAMLLLAFLIAGCTTVPPQIARTHQKELEIVQSLQSSHIAMVDAYVDERLENFEQFFFNEFGPAYYRHWIRFFQSEYGRDYDPTKDFPTLYEDLAVEYLEGVRPIEDSRNELQEAIRSEYRDAIAAHEAVGEWISSLEQLNFTQRQSLDALLHTLRPGSSLDAVDRSVQDAMDSVRAKIAKYAQEE